MEADPQAEWSWVPITFPSRTQTPAYNLVCGPIYVTDWTNRPNMVPRPNLGGNSTFLHHGPIGRGILSFVPTGAFKKEKKKTYSCYDFLMLLFVKPWFWIILVSLI